MTEVRLNQKQTLGFVIIILCSSYIRNDNPFISLFCVIACIIGGFFVSYGE